LSDHDARSDDSKPAEGRQRTWEQLLEVAHSGDSAALAALVDELDEVDRIHALGRLDAEDRGVVLAALPAEAAADLIEQLPDSHGAAAIEELTPTDAAEILDELESDERADLIAAMDRESVEAILDEAAPETVESVRELLRHAADSAGGLMITEFVAVPATWTALELVDHLQENVERYADFVIQYVYALGTRGELVGVLPLRDLVLARRERSVASLMLPSPISVRASATLPELFDLFDRYRFLGIPVVDELDRMVGVLLREDVDEARVEQAQSDELKSRGIVGGEELRSMPVLTRSGRRLSWLSINVVLNVIAASVIAAYQDTLSAAIALAVFLPIISDMSGCSGNQAVAVSLRELSLGLVRPGEVLRVWWQEASVGLVNGVVLGCLIGVVAWLWKDNGMLGVVVGAALALNTLVAVSIGGVVPLALRRLGYDPALASGPILTTITDMCGFFFVLSLATAVLSRIAVA
jgi:magnesium transporter